MDKEQIINEINKAKEHLTNMEKMLEECEYERWKPQEDETYYFVDSDLEVVNDDWANIEGQRKIYNAYNCFKTKEEAEAEAEKILVRRMLEDIAKRLNKGKKFDWTNANQYKNFICLDIKENRLGLDCNTLIKIQGIVYCLDKDFLNVAIQEIGEERLKKYLRGE